jgi:hypothetical protein
MKISKLWPKRLMGNLVLVLACQMIFAGAVAAQDDTEKYRRPKVKFEDVRTKSINLKIIGKRPEMIQTRHMKYFITDSTEVVDSKGKMMDLADLPVPCTATIYYEPSRLNKPFVWRIVYKGKMSGAKTAWSAPLTK